MDPVPAGADPVWQPYGDLMELPGAGAWGPKQVSPWPLFTGESIGTFVARRVVKTVEEIYREMNRGGGTIQFFDPLRGEYRDGSE
jgi:hypothetical protein